MRVFLFLLVTLLLRASLSSAAVSDAFDSAATSSSRWEMYCPRGPAAADPDTLLKFVDGAAVLHIGSLLDHDLWKGSQNNAPRFLQSVTDAEVRAAGFGVEAKWFTRPDTSTNNQLQGLVIEETHTKLYRFGVYSSGNKLKAFAARINGNQGTTLTNTVVSLTGATVSGLRQRVSIRADGTWSYKLSFDDGATWTEVLPAGVTLDLTAAKIGFYAGNAGQTPEFCSVLDSFQLLGPGQATLANNVGVQTAAEACAAADAPDDGGGPNESFETDYFTDAAASSTRWRFFKPTGVADPDTTVAFDAGSAAVIQVSAGRSHNLWTGSGNLAPRILQSVTGNDFAFEAKFLTSPRLRYQFHGLIVQVSDSEFLRFEVLATGATLSDVQLFAAYVTPSSNKQFSLPSLSLSSEADIPDVLRITRTTDTFKLEYGVSSSGNGLQLAATLSPTNGLPALTVTEIGVFGANHDPSPAYCSVIEYFMNVDAPGAGDSGTTDLDAACPAGDPTQPTDTEIRFFYGDSQDFGGADGVGQVFINVLGSIDGSGASIGGATWSLNGGAEQPLSLGPNKRLVEPGDFNVEIPIGDLQAGENAVVVRSGDGVTAGVVANWHGEPTQPPARPYTAEWSASADIYEGRVVDGWWSGIYEKNRWNMRTIEPGYDRLLVVGDKRWNPDGHCVTVSFKVKNWGSSDNGVGFAVGWQGHEGNSQPRLGWPLQAISWVRGGPNADLRLLTYDDGIAAQAGRQLETDTWYTIKTHSQSAGAGSSTMSTKLWKEGDPEPPAYDLTATVAHRDGSILLIAHKAEVYFSPVNVTVCEDDPNPPPPVGECTARSDEFDNLNLDEFWRFYHPVGDEGTKLITNGEEAIIELGEGVSHDLWGGSANRAPRLLQPTTNGDFVIDVKWESRPSKKYQFQGIVVQESDSHLLRFETLASDDDDQRFFIGYINGQSASQVQSGSLSDNPLWQRLVRSGNQWAFFYSYDGVNFNLAHQFTRALQVTEVGVHVGNHTPSPFFRGVLQYFRTNCEEDLIVDCVDKPYVPAPMDGTSATVTASNPDGTSVCLSFTCE